MKMIALKNLLKSKKSLKRHMHSDTINLNLERTLADINYKPYNVPTKEKIIELSAKGYHDVGFCCVGITDSCFFKCRMCDKWKEDILVDKAGSKAPSMDDWKGFLDQLGEIVSHKLNGPIESRFEVNFAGGEALSHPYTVDLIRHASSLGFNTVIASNGWLINEKMARRLHEAGLYGVNLSLDSLNPEVHDYYRGFKGASKGVLRAIESMSKYPHPRPGIISIIHKGTVSGLKDMVRWIHNNPKVKWHNLMAIMQPNNTVFEPGWHKDPHFQNLWPENTEDAIHLIDWVIEFKKQNRDERLRKEMPVIDKNVNTYPQLSAFKAYFKDPETFSKSSASCNLDKGIQVSAMGDIFMCIHKDILGNVKKDDMREVWKSQKSDMVRNKISNCRTNCHTLLNCYFEEDYPFTILNS